jgi:hypothetical protein
MQMTGQVCEITYKWGWWCFWAFFYWLGCCKPKLKFSRSM